MIFINFIGVLAGFLICFWLSKKEKYDLNLSYSFFIGILFALFFSWKVNSVWISFITGGLLVQAFLDLKYRELANNISFFLIIPYGFFFLQSSEKKQILIATILIFAFYYAFRLFTLGKGMGGGDVKVSYLFGLFGISNILPSITYPMFFYIIYYISKKVFSRVRGNEFKTNVEYFPSMFLSFVYICSMIYRI